MNNKIKLLFLGVGICNLSSCMVYEEYNTASYQGYVYNQAQLYPQADYRMYNYGYQQNMPNQGGVNVPDSYHVGESHSPVSFKDRDRTWVNGQNPQGYTIQVADDEKASRVAQKLYKAPKNDRMAQIKYQRNGKSYYKGVYGTYDSQEAAQKALDALPPEMKQGAGITNWGNVQNNMDE